MRNKGWMESAQQKIAVALIALAGTLVTVVFSYTLGKRKAENEAAIAFTFPKEHFNLRLEEYPKLWALLIPVSKYGKQKGKLTLEEAHKLAEQLNDWYYGRGGLVAGEQTRTLVYKLLTACANWQAGEQPGDIHMLKNWVMYSSRNDLQIISQEDFDYISVDMLKDMTRKRNRAIKQLRERASLVDE